ncbi:hypothetical protein HK096_011392 [Nowakowskiella sp. JEL0078]|nr:hypothetical protein HK096_011392 [Nowakowskiella sp. JEL0078]
MSPVMEFPEVPSIDLNWSWETSESKASESSIENPGSKSTETPKVVDEDEKSLADDSESDIEQPSPAQDTRPKHVFTMSGITIETDDPSNLFWVPAHLHPEVHPELHNSEHQHWLAQFPESKPEDLGTTRLSLSRSLGPSPLRRAKSYLESNDTNDVPKAYRSLPPARRRLHSVAYKEPRRSKTEIGDNSGIKGYSSIKGYPADQMATLSRKRSTLGRSTMRKYTWDERWVAQLASNIADIDDDVLMNPEKTSSPSLGIVVLDGEIKDGGTTISTLDRRKRRSKISRIRKAKGKSKVLTLGPDDDVFETSSFVSSIVEENNVDVWLLPDKDSLKTKEPKPDVVSVALNTDMIIAGSIESMPVNYVPFDDMATQAGDEITEIFHSQLEDITASSQPKPQPTPKKKKSSGLNISRKNWKWFVGLVRTPKEKPKTTDLISDDTDNSIRGRGAIDISRPRYTASEEFMGGFGPRYPLHVEKSIYRMSHGKLAEHRRTLLDQVLISNLMIYVISVHADVTLNRQGPRKKLKKGRKRSRSPGMQQHRPRRSSTLATSLTPNDAALTLQTDPSIAGGLAQVTVDDKRRGRRRRRQMDATTINASDSESDLSSDENVDHVTHLQQQEQQHLYPLPPPLTPPMSPEYQRHTTTPPPKLYIRAPHEYTPHHDYVGVTPVNTPLSPPLTSPPSDFIIPPAEQQHQNVHTITSPVLPRGINISQRIPPPLLRDAVAAQHQQPPKTVLIPQPPPTSSMRFSPVLMPMVAAAAPTLSIATPTSNTWIVRKPPPQVHHGNNTWEDQSAWVRQRVSGELRRQADEEDDVPLGMLQGRR